MEQPVLKPPPEPSVPLFARLVTLFTKQTPKAPSGGLDLVEETLNAGVEFRLPSALTAFAE